MPKVCFRTLCSAALVALALMATVPAHAQADDAQRSAARTFATDGRTAYNAGQYEKAIDLFTRAEALVHAPPHLLFLARASMKMGKLVHAKELYVKIAREELAANAPKAFVDAKAAAATEQAEVEPRIAKLTIVLAGPGADKATVTMDGVEVPAALIGVAQPADPGVHQLRASAAGWSAIDGRVSLEEHGVGETTLTLDKPAPNEVSEPPAEVEKPSTLRRVAPFIALGVGALGIAGGTVMLLKNHSNRDKADELCPNGRCPVSQRPEVQSLDKKADKEVTFSWIGYAVGVAGLATAGVLFVLDRRSKPAQPKVGWTMTPWFGAGSAGVNGRF